MLLIGYDRLRRTWLFKNSWGAWTEQSYDTAQIQGGTCIVDAAPSDALPQMHAWWVGRWNIDHDGWRGTLMIRRFTNRRDSPGSDFYDLDRHPTKLGDYYGPGGRREVHGYFINAGRTMVFYVARDESRYPPGSLVGDMFEAHVFSWDPSNAGGQMSWSGTPYGVFMTREDLPVAKSVPFERSHWEGSWSMSHDGWMGVLEISSVAADGAVTAGYTTAAGDYLPVYARLDDLAGHILHARVAFPNNDQWFVLYHHTQEEGVMSGVTSWGGQGWGVQGTKL